MPLPSIAIIAAIVVLGVVLLARQQVRRSRARAALLTTMGFRPVEQPDPQLTEALLEPFRRGRLAGKRLALREVWSSDAAGGRVCVFDVLNPASPRQSLVASNAVGVVRRGMRLPALEICAYAERGGTLEQMMVGFITKGLGNGRIVRFDDVPEFGKRFTVLVPADEGEEVVRGYLTASRRQELLASQFLILKAEGDGFALQPNPTSPAGRAGELALLRALIEEAHRLARVLEPGPVPPA
jgi:hypothetical protein